MCEYIYINVYIYIYMYIYIYTCVCLCVFIYIYIMYNLYKIYLPIYIYIYVCVCVCIYMYKCYTPMITSQNSIRNVSVATDEGPSPKLALSEGGSRGNIES